jgi:hypothetical protein
MEELLARLQQVLQALNQVVVEVVPHQLLVQVVLEESS